MLSGGYFFKIGVNIFFHASKLKTFKAISTALIYIGDK